MTARRRQRPEAPASTSTSAVRVGLSSLTLLSMLTFMTILCQVVGVGNPASAHCEEKGGTVQIRNDEDGEYGMCILPDRTECEEWSYFRGECGDDGAGARSSTSSGSGGLGGVGMANPASVNCVEYGGTPEIRSKGGSGEEGGEMMQGGSPYHVCVFEDGSECEEWAFYREECVPGGTEAGASNNVDGGGSSGEDDNSTRSSSSSPRTASKGAACASIVLLSALRLYLIM